MLTLNVAAREFFDDKTQTFVNVPSQTITLEHSLISLYKWEAAWEKPYLSKKPKSRIEALDYIRCMSINKEITLETIMSLTDDQIKQINTYIDAPMTATTFSKDTAAPSRQVITAEVIYWQMINAQIPITCEKWHLNRLFTLIRVCNIKSNKPKKMGKQDLINRNKQLNQARRAQMNSKG